MLSCLNLPRNDESYSISSFAYNRIVVIGTTSSGKSTLAENIAKRFDLHCVDLDALHWEPDWQGAPLEVWSGKGVTLLSLPPLRTVRATFTAYRSSIPKALLDKERPVNPFLR